MYVACMYACVYVVYLYVYKLYMYVYICTCLYMHEIYSICATSALTSGLNEHGNPMNRINLDKCRKKNCERGRTSSQNERCIRPVSNRPSVRSAYLCSDNSNQRRQGEKRDIFHEAQHFPPSHFPFQAWLLAPAITPDRPGSGRVQAPLSLTGHRSIKALIHLFQCGGEGRWEGGNWTRGQRGRRERMRGKGEVDKGGKGR